MRLGGLPMSGKPNYEALRKRVGDLEQKIADRRRDNSMLKKYTQDLKFLSRMSTEFLEFPPEENIYPLIGERLKELVGDCVIAINSYDKETDTLRTRALTGLGKHSKTVLKLIGRDPVGMSFPITDEYGRSQLAAGKLVTGPRGLYEISFGKIPAGICRRIEDLLGLGDIYAIGLACKGELFGSAIIFTRRGRGGLEGKDIVETFMHQAAVALQRSEAERALIKARDELERRVEERTADLAKANEHLTLEIEERKRAEEVLKAREKELQAKTTNLEEVNTALRVLLDKRDEDRKELEEKVKSNMKWMVVPYLEKMKKSGLNQTQEAYANILEALLSDVISPFTHKLSTQHANLTPTEIQVAHHIKDGKTTKEVAEMLNSSMRAIEFHRENLRKKLGLKNRKINLRSHLLSLS
jgi:DNA-binding CsgD family transcriptional regulator